MSDLLVKDASLIAVADALRTAGGTTESLSFPDDFVETARQLGDAYQDGVAHGKQTEYDKFWDVYQKNGERSEYARAFFGQGWTDKTFYPKYHIKGNDVAYFTFQAFNSEGEPFDLAQRLEECGVVLDTSRSRFNDPFTGAVVSRLPTIDATGNYNSYCAPFTDCKWLVTIDKWILKNDPTVTFANAFRYNYALENIVVEGVIGQSITFNHSSLLSTASVQSIINALYDYTGGSAKTIAFHTTVKKNMTDEQIAQITAKNWTLA